MNKQEEVIQVIREQLPRLMKLDEGCEFIDDLGHKQLIVGIYEDNEYNTRLFTVCVDDESTEAFYPPLGKQCKIIGKEPTILDALECFPKRRDFYYSITPDGFLINCCKRTNTFGYVTATYTGLKDNSVFKEISIEVDLSNLLIKDQSEQTINFLHSVLWN